MRKFCAVLLMMLGAIVALAIDVRALGATVYVNQAPVMTVGSPKRAAELAQLLSKAPSLTPISVQGSGSDVRLVAGKTVIRVMAAEGKSAQLSPQQLAGEWASKLRDALKLPALDTPNRTVQVGVGSERLISVVGTAASAATGASSNPKVATVSKAAMGFKVKGNQLGSTTVKVRSGSQVITTVVQVLPPAAKFPQSVSASVVGDPASPDIVRNAIVSGAQSQMKMAPNADVEIVDAKVVSLQQGASTTIQAKVRVTAPNTVASEGLVTAKVNNLMVAGKREGEMWYCNFPETVMGPGNLFAADLKEKTPARMLYHHINATTDPLVIQVVAVNTFDTPVKIVIMPGDGVPHKDPVRVGLEAGERFVRNWMTGSGEVISIPARASVPIAMRRLAPGETMSGLCYLRVLNGPTNRVLIRTDAVDPRFMDAGWLSAANLATPWSKAGTRKIGPGFQTPPLSQHIYTEPYKVLESTYQVGGRFAFVWVGQKPISSVDGELALDGNFGVMYTVKLRVENPTDRAVDVEVVFEASAGYSGAVFIVNNQFQRAPLLQSKAEYILKKVSVPAGGSQEVTVQTVPLSGSSYPALLTLRPSGLGMK
ncbi:MAG: hypothetical protein K1X67_14920 [Fimbriimonadaceae bacterium]|nr:hypothetical protein [Fimbriimonadaceae bacterium]